MGKKLSWVFELFDKFSPKAKAIGRSLDEIARKMKRAAGETKKTGDATKKAGEAAKKAGDGFGSFGLKLSGWIYTARSAMSVVGGLARGVGGLAFGFAKAGIDAASFKESTMLGLRMMLRDPAKATALYKEAVNFADVSPFETRETLQWYRQLVPGLGTQGI